MDGERADTQEQAIRRLAGDHPLSDSQRCQSGSG
jgi:hypothetical protein